SLTALLLFLFPFVARAQDPITNLDRDISRCENREEYTPDTVIALCTKLIDSGELSGTHLSDILVSRGIAYSGKRDFESALRDYRLALRANPKHLYAADGIAQILLERGDSEGAIEEMNRALEKNPGDASLLTNRGRAYLKKFDLDRAIQDFDAAIAADPKFA